YATVPSEALTTGIDVLTDAVRHSRFDPDEIRREQDVVIEEIRRSDDTPGHVLSELSFGEAYRVHPYRLPVLGTTESVAALDSDRCFNFFRRWYAPDNLTLVAAGDFDAQAVADQVQSAFEGSHPAGAKRQRIEEPVHDRMRCRVLRRSFERQRIELCYPASSFRQEDATHLDLLAFLLGECESSRLVRDIRNAGLADRVHASSYTPFDRGLFSVELETDEERSRQAVERVAERIETLRLEPVAESELERARINFLASEHFERETATGLASKLGNFEVMGAGWETEAVYLETLRRATCEDLLRIAQHYLSPEQLTVSALIPDTPGDTLDAESLSAAVSAGVDRARARRSHPQTRSATASKRKAVSSPRPLASKNEQDDTIHTYSLEGGATLHVAPRHTLPIVAARFVFRGGLLAESPETAGLTSFLASMWTRGTLAHPSAPQFASAAEDLAADIGGFSGRSSQGLSLEVTRDNWLEGLNLVTETLLEPLFGDQEFATERREILAAIERREDQLAQRAFLLFARTQFKEHPYRLPILGERTSVESLTLEQVRAHHERLICSPNLVMAVAGDIDPDETAEEISSRLAALRSGPFDSILPPEEPPPDQIREIVNKKDRAQAHLVMGFRGLKVNDPDRYGLELISQLLAGQGGRLFLELRDRRGLAYSVGASNVEGLAPGFFAVYVATAPDKVEEARTEILEQLEALIQEGPSEDELAQTQRNLIGNFVIGQQRCATRAGHIALNGLYGLGPDADREYSSRVAALSRDDVLRIARRVIRLDAYTLALIRP
ncbi:MAG: pitrilysin family protein, partial [Myxococcota bacterium]